MAVVRPFKAIMPVKGMEEKVAALPYDVYNRAEAAAYVEKHPSSFLKIDRPETNFSTDVDIYDDIVYDKARELIEEYCNTGIFEEREKPCFYLYELTMDGRTQAGIVGCASVEDYNNNIVKKHENTLASKEKDRIRHISVTGMQTGPIFLAFNSTGALDELIREVSAREAYYDFVSEDGIGHRVWLIEDDDEMKLISGEFAGLGNVYIADGHHRCASACRVGNERHKDGEEQESDFFLSVLFPANQLKIMDYNRVIKELGDQTVQEFIDKVGSFYDIIPVDSEYKPEKKGDCGMYIDGRWYKLSVKPEYTSDDPVEGLDVAILQKYVLDGILGIKDPKTDSRIDFVGGIRGLGELVRRCSGDGDGVAAFAMYPTDIMELFAVADADRLMPPKSTWFEPKLRSGLFLHKI